MTSCCPGWTSAGGVRLLAFMMAGAGTPYRRAMVSMVSPGPTVTGVPPSQLQCPLGAGLGVVTAPVTSGASAPAAGAAVELGVYEAIPLPPPDTPVLAAACGGSG